jgi:hypothetical protein
MDDRGRLAAAVSGATPAHDGIPLELAGGRRSAALKLGFRRGFVLRHRSDAGRSFCSPSNVGERRWWLATVRRFSQDLMALRVTSGVSPMMGTAPTVVVDLHDSRLGMDSNTDMTVK